MPRAKAFDPDQALDAALTLFWEKGFEATSMQDLVERMGINRFSLYSTFGDKRQLYRAALERYRTQFVDEMIGPLEVEGASLDTIRGYFDKAIEMYSSDDGWRGCLFINCAVDAPASEHDDDRVTADGHLSRVERAFHGALSQAKTDGLLGDRHDIGELARFLVTASMGIGVLARARVAPEALTQSAKVVLETLRA